MTFTRKQWRDNGMASKLDYILVEREPTQVLHTFTMSQVLQYAGPLSSVCHDAERRRTKPRKQKESVGGMSAT